MYKRLSCLLLLALTGAVRAEPDEARGEVPVIGRPNDPAFSEASGRFKITASAEPKTVEAEAPVTFTLLIEADGPVYLPPRRIDLRKLPGFEEAFFIEDLPDRPSPDGKRWEFAWRLKPRRAGSIEIPEVRFIYFDPDIRAAQPEKRFPVLYTNPIPLEVHERAAVPVPLQGPSAAFVLLSGPDVLKRPASPGLPSAWALTLVVVVPPVLCGLWYLTWRRRNPDAARLADQRRSRAARRAIHRLEGLRQRLAAERAAAVAEAITGYLHERLELTAREPTPVEAQGHLLRLGLPGDVAGRTADLYRACDTARFQPGGAVVEGLAEDGVKLILALEAATCTPSS